MAKACQLFSGSSGNSIYIGNNNAGILVDIGVSAKRCEYQLSRIGVSTDSIKAIFVTHEHRDHIAGVRVFASKFNIPVFAAPETLEEMRKLEIINGKFDVYDIENETDINGIGVEAFKNSHDAACCLGYKITMPDGRRISVCTDTGYVTDDAKVALSGTDMIFLESHHEISMLENHSRECYGGYVGFVTPDGLKCYVNLRSLKLNSTGYCIFAGGGITAESIPEDEWRETENKTMILRGNINDAIIK